MSNENKPNSGSGWNSWVPIIILFCVGLWPIALFLLARKLLNYDNSPASLFRMGQKTVYTVRDLIESDEKKRRRSRHPYDIQQEEQRQQAQQGQETRQSQQTDQGQYAQQHEQEARRQDQTAWQQTASRVDSHTVPPKGPEPKKQKKAAKKAGAASGQPKVKVPGGRVLTVIGACVAGVFGLGFMSELLQCLDYLSWEMSWGLFWSLRHEYFELAPLLGFFTAGLVMFFYGIARTRKGRRFRKYLPLIGRQTSVSIDALAKAAGKRRRRVMKDLQEMLDIGLLGTGYLDLSRDRLVLSDEGISDEEEPSPQPEPEPPQDDYAVLQEIRQVNDAIPDPVMSAKIDRIGEITGKILDYQRQNPGKDSQLRSFLNYYLPTTLKILRAYAQLDAQGVEGENISAAKERIEGMMDKVVEGFEKQLDELFRDRAMDITSDVSVLERMLEKDGLSSSGQGMTLGG